jgi:hypothetical protein
VTRAALRYWRASATLLVLVAAAGFILVARRKPALLGEFLAFDTAHNVLHAALALLAIVFATGLLPERVTRAAAGWVGVFYLALAVLGFMSARLFGLGPLVGMRLELGENALHLALGAWGAYVGFRH